MDRNSSMNGSQISGNSGGNRQSQLERADRMYRYAKEYDRHKDSLRKESKDKELEGHTFSPRVNPKSEALMSQNTNDFGRRTIHSY